MFDNFFSNISEKIKAIAKILLVLGLIGAFGCFVFAMIVSGDNEELAFMLLCIGVPASFLVMLIPSWFIYGFGQLIENTGNAQNNCATPVAPTPAVQSSTAFCKNCGSKVESTHSFCQKCGTKTQN